MSGQEFMFEFMIKTENLFSFFNIHSGLHEELQGESFTSTALNMKKIYDLTSAEQSCKMSHRSNRTRTVQQEEQRKSSKHDLKVSELLQKVFPMLSKEKLEQMKLYLYQVYILPSERRK
ncbi:hypothetical protein ATANTOWER_032638 [Ataeniobius toweri]|uniref:Uncharacterized protein n=1 Tax=Ataeniobius toweri TaxID=208326 RepID=A0ABU7B1I4_9TELE|nr:hypothetical protein [Ataeniobius toweri]